MTNAPVAPASATRRNPKRQKTGTTTYKENTESDDENLIDDDDVHSWTWELDEPDEPKRKKSKPDKFKPFRLMDLPNEIRFMILRVVVTNPDGFVRLQSRSLTNGRDRRWLQRTGTMNLHHHRYGNPNMILASKQIYGEAMHEIYTKQTFCFTSLSAFQTFILPMSTKTLELLRRVKVSVGSTEWSMMPAVASFMVQLRFVKSIEIHGLNHVTSSRCLEKYLKATPNPRPISSWPCTLESWDKLQGIKLARDTYPFMYTFYNPIIGAGPAVVEVQGQDSDVTPVPSTSNKQSTSIGQSTSNEKSISNENSILNKTSIFGKKYKFSKKSTSNKKSASNEKSPPPYKNANIVLENKPEPKPLMGVDDLVRVLEFTESPRRLWGVPTPGIPQWHWHTQLVYATQWRGATFYKEKMTDTRCEIIKASMAEELVKLKANDTY